jgi:predicted dehydrogenase/sugar phosphate isomerase/epimerase
VGGRIPPGRRSAGDCGRCHGRGPGDALGVLFGAYHEEELAERSAEKALAIAEALRGQGVYKIILNPDPLPGGAPKTDAQLLIQSTALDRLGAALAAAGTRLLYHSHDPEMKNGAREFHTMLVNTDPKSVGLCLDVHWLYRGAGNSQTAVHDIVSLYSDRIDLIHLRQSVDGVWTESIGAGDVDYTLLGRHLAKHKDKALLVIELAAEKGTPGVLTGEQAHAQAVDYLAPLLEPVAVEPLPLRIYLIGAGAIARLHPATAARNLTNYELYATDPSKETRDGFQTAVPAATTFEDGETMLASSPAQDRDIVIVAVPPRWHQSVALAAIKSNRQVLCEKPVALSSEDLDELLAAARATGRHFGDCSVRFLCNDALPRAREILSAGGIGRPYHARLVNRKPRIRPGIEFQPASKWFLDRAVADGGGIGYDWCVYDLAMLFDMLRPVAARIHHAFTDTPRTAADPPDYPISVESHFGASLTLTLAGGATVALDFERASGFHGEVQSLLNIDGSEGGLAWEWCPPFESGTAVKLKHYVDVEGKVAKKEFPLFDWDDVHGRPLLAFVDLVLGNESVILPEKRLKFNFEVLSGIYQCSESGQPVEVRLEEKI